MSSEKPHIDEALRAWAQEAAIGADHPTDARLDALHADRLDAETADAVRGHLAICRTCADRFLARERRAPDPMTRTPKASRPSPVLALAASALLAFGLGWWLRSGPLSRAEPVTEVAFRHLDRPGLERAFDVESSPQVLRLPARARRLVLVLPLGDDEPRGPFELTLRRGDERVFAASDVRAIEHEITLLLPTALLLRDSIYILSIDPAGADGGDRLAFRIEVAP